MANTAALSEQERKAFEQIAADYVRRTKHWQTHEFRIEHRPDESKPQQAVFWAIYLEDEKQIVPGSGQSLELYLDRASGQVVRELRFQ